MRAVPTPMSGLAATMTSVSFQPFTKPMQKPHTKVVKRCKKMATWSAMASLILLISLRDGSRRRQHIQPLPHLLARLPKNPSGHCGTHSDMRVLSSPTEVQSNQPISILITFLKYIFLMS